MKLLIFFLYFSFNLYIEFYIYIYGNGGIYNIRLYTAIKLETYYEKVLSSDVSETSEK